MSTAVVLFTRDLRVHDQPALAEAARSSEHIVPLFVLDDRILRDGDASNRLSFLLEALDDLRVSLRERAGDLIVRRGDPLVEMLRIARAVNAHAVFVGGDASAYARTRERRLTRECTAERIDVRVLNTTAIVPPQMLTPTDGDHYRVFTPYWRRWEALPLRSVLPAPRRLSLPAKVVAGDLPALRELTNRAPSPQLPPGGERAGRERLERWRVEGYRQGDELGADSTSRLSPYLHFGCVSPVEIAARTRDQPGGDAFVRQLCWRDFFLQLLAANPSLPREDLRPRGDDWSADDEAFARWREGRTGYPIVDAGMRQLAREGWLPNRARLIVASFLTKTLYLDWRLGADVFSRLLVDADVASNVGNWQWVAGTGADTRPNRVLNPVRQAKRFDPDATYVRRHVPELAAVDPSHVHEPWKARGVAPEYPDRIVDHSEAGWRFREARQTALESARA
jgi:deoxyribodipyrimidine photo-lyase